MHTENTFTNLTVEALTHGSTTEGVTSLFFTAEGASVRKRVIDVLLFYLSLGVPRGRLRRMLIGNQEVEGGGPLVIPILELSALSNVTFPQVLSKLRRKVQKMLLFKERDYMMTRWFCLVEDLDESSLRSVLRTFHAPFERWAACIRRNLLGIRDSWIIWSSSFKQEEKRT